MTAADIPLTTGQADQGGEGQRFMVYTVYDSLVLWDLTSATKPSVLVPGLALSWDAYAKTPSGTGPWKLTLKVVIPSSGSGMMQPLPMNEFLQQNLGEVGVKVNLEVLEWNTLLAAWRGGAKDPASRGGVALNYSYFAQDPFTAFVRHFQSDLVSPKGTNWGHYSSKEMDGLFSQARNTFDPKEQTVALQKIHEKFVNEDLFLDVTHDVNARAMSSKVKGFVQAQNWFQNFSSITMTK